VLPRKQGELATLKAGRPSAVTRQEKITPKTSLTITRAAGPPERRFVFMLSALNTLQTSAFSLHPLAFL
jgi:hypothetical protein